MEQINARINTLNEEKASLLQKQEDLKAIQADLLDFVNSDSSISIFQKFQDITTLD